MENNIKILFWLKKNRKNKKGLMPLILRVTFSNTRKEISTGYFINPEIWNAHNCLLRGKSQEAIQINTYINATKVKLIKLYNDALMVGDFSLDSIIAKFLGKNNNLVTLMQAVYHHIEYFKARIGTIYSKSTFMTYLLTENRLKSFLKDQDGKTDIRLKDLKLEFIQGFDLYLRTVFHNEHNTIVKQCKNLKRVINMAIENQWLERNPFIGFKSNFKEIDPVFLSQQELDLIAHKDFVNKRLERVRDLFIFQCYTGFAFADMAKLKTGDVSEGVDGGPWIIIRRKKTDKRSAFPLLAQALAIIDKYKDYEATGNRLLPTHSPQKFNAYLDELAGVCNIHKHLTSHLGRRTFATTIALATNH